MTRFRSNARARSPHSHQCWRLRTIRQLLKQQADKQQSFAFMDEHPIIRLLSEYQQFASTAIAEHDKEYGT